MLEGILEALPLILAAIVPPVVMAVRKLIADSVPAKYLPIAIAIGGGLVASIGTVLGVDTSALQETSSDPTVWQNAIMGIVVGLAGVGVHQSVKQVKKA